MSRVRKRRRVRFRKPEIAVPQILAWADEHYERTGGWPRHDSGPILGSLGENWNAVDCALRGGLRGFPGGSSLARLLDEHRGVRNPGHLPPLTEPQILAWADAHHARAGDWPNRNSGPIPDSQGETWGAVNACLSQGVRGLPGGSSLTRLLLERRGVRSKGYAPALTLPQILAWADAHRQRTGNWPTARSGPIQDSGRETWGGVNAALMTGIRGLPGGSSLPKVLAEHRGVRNIHDLLPLSLPQVLAWADAYHAEMGQWPTRDAGPVAGSDGETWSGVDAALKAGSRALPGRLSLALLLKQHRGVRYSAHLPRLSIPQILAWASAHRQRTGRWPSEDAGEIPDSGGETWGAITDALRQGGRGLPGGSSLAQLLGKERRVRNRRNPPPLTILQILVWADNHHEHTGRWPTRGSGRIVGVRGETWGAVDSALERGHRGLPGGSSLARLLAQRRGVRNPKMLPPLSVSQILAWADAHYRRTGTWPKASGGAIAGTDGEIWRLVDVALRRGGRGLPGGSSLPQLLARHRCVPNQLTAPPLTEAQILAWADAHYREFGRWPTVKAGAIAAREGESWQNVDNDLRLGLRGLAGGSSLAKLLARERGVRNPAQLPRLTVRQVEQWARAYRDRTGSWPTRQAGPVAEAPGETWAAIDAALHVGYRGLPGGSSVARLVARIEASLV